MSFTRTTASVSFPTLEATCAALAQLEGSVEQFQPLLTAFALWPGLSEAGGAGGGYYFGAARGLSLGELWGWAGASGRHHQPLPGIGFKALQPLFSKRWHRVKTGYSLRAGYTDRNEPAGQDVLVTARGVA